MKLAMMINYTGDFHADVTRIQELEKAGLDVVWVPEAYSYDAISQVGFLAAKTERVEIGTGIINVFSRTATAIAQTAAGCDFVSDGRFILGLGASGPQVIEGFHGVPYEKPMPRIREYIEVCRMVWKREPVVYDGQTVHIPLPPGQGTGLGKPLKLINHPKRADIPVFWAEPDGQERHRDGQARRRLAADLLRPREVPAGVGRRDRRRPRRARPGARTAADLGRRHGRHRRRVRRRRRRPRARHGPPEQPRCYVGGMGARDKNFYNTIAKKYGYVDEATEIQDLYLSGRKEEAAAAVPRAAPGEHEPRRAGGPRQGAHRRLPGRRRHPPVDQPCRPRPGQDRRDPAHPHRVRSYVSEQTRVGAVRSR